MKQAPAAAICSQFDGDSDEDLLFYMSLCGEDPASARAAWAEFYLRHRRYLYGVCWCAYGALIGKEGVADLVQDTFIRVFKKAGKYKRVDGKGREEGTRLVRAWLGKVANRLFLSALRSPQEEPTDLESADDTNLIEWGAEDPTPASSRVLLLREALNTLNEREQHVLRVTALWLKSDGGHQRLPNREMAELSKSLNTTSTNIRKIRQRAIEKVRAYVESRST